MMSQSWYFIFYIWSSIQDKIEIVFCNWFIECTITWKSLFIHFVAILNIFGSSSKLELKLSSVQKAGHGLSWQIWSWSLLLLVFISKPILATKTEQSFAVYRRTCPNIMKDQRLWWPILDGINCGICAKPLRNLLGRGEVGRLIWTELMLQELFEDVLSACCTFYPKMLCPSDSGILTTPMIKGLPFKWQNQRRSRVTVVYAFNKDYQNQMEKLIFCPTL